jgi:hypothetical protein
MKFRDLPVASSAVDGAFIANIAITRQGLICDYRNNILR